jgi:hypothetical protein
MRGYTPEFLAKLQHAYEQTERPLRLMAKDFRMGERTLYRIAERSGWTRAPRGLPSALRALQDASALLTQTDAVSTHDKGPPTPDPSPPRASFAGVWEQNAAERIAQLVQKELAAAEVMRAQLRAGDCAPIDAERMARTLSTLTQTLQTLQRLHAGKATRTDDHDDIPRDIDAFRRELARRIDAFIASRTDRTGDRSDAGAMVDDPRA